MEHFDIILALAQAAVAGDLERSRHQLARLRDHLDAKQAEKLTRLLKRDERRQAVAPLTKRPRRPWRASCFRKRAMARRRFFPSN
jgi:hypothetical protein